MQAKDFAAFHGAALEQDEARHGLILGVMASIVAHNPPNVRLWTLGAPGACALQMGTRPLVLGALDAEQCHALADDTVTVPYPGVVGQDLTAQWFVERATARGLAFQEPMPQRIHILDGKPRYPGAAGNARLLEDGDVDLFHDWLTAFTREAVPHEIPHDRSAAERIARERRHMLWVVDGEPVSMAGIVRRTRNSAAIAAVYTPQALRGRGYAGSVTAAVADLAFAQGKSFACLYTDLRNPYSNRCYAKVGFVPVCESWHFNRA